MSNTPATTNKLEQIPGLLRPFSKVQLPSVYVVKNYGPSINQMRHALDWQWNIHESLALKNNLLPGVQLTDIVKARLLKWDVSFALKQASKGYIVLEGVQYVVEYFGCTRRSLAIHSKALLSFRGAASEYGLYNKVLIKPFYQTPTDINSAAEEIQP